MSEVFPLLSCEISGPGSGIDEGAATRSVGTASTSSEYDAQRSGIVAEWGKFRSVYSITYDSFPKFIKDISGLAGSVTDFFENWGRESPGSTASGNFSVDPATGQAVASGYTPFEEFIISSAKFLEPLTGMKVNDKDAIPPSGYVEKVKADAYGNISLSKYKFEASLKPPHKAVEISLGLLGSFNSTWGNIESSIGVALFTSLDTNFTASAKYSDNGNNAIALTLLDFTLPLGKTPPIIIGPVSISLSLQTGIKLPFSIEAAGNIRLGYRLAFSGIYGAMATAGFNYGITFTNKKVLWWTIPIPTGGYLNPYGDAGILNKTACYVGPDDFIVFPTTPLLTGASASISVSPTVFIDGRVLFWDWLYFGACAEAGEEFRFTTTVTPKKGQTMPVVKGVGTASHFWNANIGAGVSFVIPIVNWRIDKSFTLWSSPANKTEWARWNAFAIGE